MKDISNRKDIEKLVFVFYEKVKSDKLIGFFFDETANINWEKHLLIMSNFWDNILFFAGNYEGHPMDLHLHINKLSSITKKHFNRWLKLFIETIDEMYVGEKATLAKEKAVNIATIMQKNIFKKSK